MLHCNVNTVDALDPTPCAACHLTPPPSSSLLPTTPPHSASTTPQADWNIVKRGWEAHVLGEAPHKFTNAVEAIKTLRVGGGPCHQHTMQCQHHNNHTMSASSCHQYTMQL